MERAAYAAGRRTERILSSPNFRDGVVRNILPTPRMERPWALDNLTRMGKTSLEFLDRGVERVPRTPPPVVTPDVEEIARRAPGLRITWLGHSTSLVAIDGALFLTDPVFAKRVSPVPFAGPARFHAPPLSIGALPPLDAVVLSHDHFDHLDKAAVRLLAGTGVPLVVPLGVGGALAAWGIPDGQVTELDWWESVEVGGVELHLTPARHFSGRGPGRMNTTLWGSWAFIGPRHKAWFSGDTGPFDAGVREIGDRFGGFDVAMIETGAWHPAWDEIHLGPLQAVRMHELVRARALVPIHWGTFNLALHAWDEPILHVQELMENRSSALLAPVAGGTVAPDHPHVAPAWRDRWMEWRETDPDLSALRDPNDA